MELVSALFSPSTKINLPRQNFLYKISNIKKFLTFSQEKAFLIFQERKNSKKLLIFSQKKAFFISESFLSHKKIIYISGNGTFLYFRNVYPEPWHNGAFLYFETGIFRILTYLEQEAHSEPSYIQNPRHIQNIIKHLQWNVLQK